MNYKQICEKYEVQNLIDADLICADLSGADLSGANLNNIKLSLDEAPIIKDIHKKLYECVKEEGRLEMSNWHECETTHCRAGWIVTMAGEEGLALEEKLGMPMAALLIYLKSEPSLDRCPDFYASNEDAMKDIKKMAGV